MAAWVRSLPPAVRITFAQRTMSSSVSSPPSCLQSAICVPSKTLMGPGPSNAHPRVLAAAALPVLGHLHPEFCKIMDDCKAGIQYAFQTSNPLTLCLSASGHAAIEAVMTNLLEKDDVVLIAENGIWGSRAADMAARQGAVVQKVCNPPGVAFSLAQISAALEQFRPTLFFITHGESSSGVVQDLDGIGEACRKFDCLLAVDTVASLGGSAVAMDALQIDAMYTGCQKVLGVPPGLAPISFGPRAVAKLDRRRSPPHSYYLDMKLLGKYWSCFGDAVRLYHHTGPVNAIYGLREALALLAEEGLEASWKRHAECADKLRKGIEALGLELFVPDAASRLPTITTVKVPPGVDWKAVTGFAMQKYMVEISGGLGPTVDQVWRIGLMGQNATPDKVDLVLKALKEGIEHARAAKM